MFFENSRENLLRPTLSAGIARQMKAHRVQFFVLTAGKKLVQPRSCARIAEQGRNGIGKIRKRLPSSQLLISLTTMPTLTLT